MFFIDKLSKGNHLFHFEKIKNNHLLTHSLDVNGGVSTIFKVSVWTCSLPGLFSILFLFFKFLDFTSSTFRRRQGRSSFPRGALAWPWFHGAVMRRERALPLPHLEKAQDNNREREGPRGVETKMPAKVHRLAAPPPTPPCPPSSSTLKRLLDGFCRPPVLPFTHNGR